jgi:hypothetical protein
MGAPARALRRLISLSGRNRLQRRSSSSTRSRTTWSRPAGPFTSTWTSLPIARKRSSAGATMVAIAPQLPWLLVMGEASEDDPGVAAQPEDAEPVSSWVLAEPDTAAEVVVAPVCLAAMPAPRPRNSTALSSPATTRERAAGWRRLAGRRGRASVVGVGSMTVPSGGCWSGDEPARRSLAPP